MANPLTIMEEAAAHWNQAKIALYDRETSNDHYIGALVHLFSLGSTPKNKTIVDLGCGTGVSTLTAYHALDPMRMFGVDPSEHALTIARSRVSSLNVSLVRGVAENLPALVKRANVVVDAGSFIYYTDPDLVLENIRTILPQDGELYVYTFLVVEGKAVERVLDASGRRVPFVGKNYTQVQLEGLLAAHNFEITKSDFRDLTQEQIVKGKYVWYHAVKR